MTIELSLALLAASAPLTAVLIKFLPTKNGKHVTIREYDKDTAGLGNKLVGIDGRLDALDTRMRDLTTAVESRMN